MNCKFCNNFIPDDAKVCSICGKSVADEALVVAETTAVAEAAPAAAEAAAKPAKVYKKKSLTLPLVIILIAAAAFVYMWVFDANGIASCTDYLKGNTADVQQSATDAEDDPFGDIGSAVEETVNENSSEDTVSDSTVAVGANAAAGAVGLAGVALLGKRMSGNRKAKKQG